MNQRSAYFDNGKFLLIFFVVLGHLLTTYKDQQSINALYNVIYTFHMPAFMLISGHFAKGIFDKDYLQKLAKKLVLPYAIFQIMYTIVYYYLYQRDTFVIDLFNPEWSLWFLLSLFSMYLLLPLFTKMKKGLSLTIAVALSLLAGYVGFVGEYLSLSRTLFFFPYFLLGFYLKKEHISLFSARKNIVPALLIIAGTFLFFYLSPAFDYQWLFGSAPYAAMKSDLSLAFLQRLFVYLAGILMLYSFFALIPKKNYWFTVIGKYTLYVYLLHGFVVKLFRASPLESFISEYQLYWALAPATFFVVYILSTKAVRSAAQTFVEIKLPKLPKFPKVTPKVSDAPKFVE